MDITDLDFGRGHDYVIIGLPDDIWLGVGDTLVSIQHGDFIFDAFSKDDLASFEFKNHFDPGKLAYIKGEHLLVRNSVKDEWGDAYFVKYNCEKAQIEACKSKDCEGEHYSYNFEIPYYYVPLSWKIKRFFKELYKRAS